MEIELLKFNFIEVNVTILKMEVNVEVVLETMTFTLQ